jgi:hypothetical protein
VCLVNENGFYLGLLVDQIYLVVTHGTGATFLFTVLGHVFLMGRENCSRVKIIKERVIGQS